jgi:hypothetical protein
LTAATGNAVVEEDVKEDVAEEDMEGGGSNACRR